MVPVFEKETVKILLADHLGGEKGKRGPAPVSTDKLAVFLVEMLKGKGPLFLARHRGRGGGRRVHRQAGSRQGRPPKWSYFSGLYRAVEAVPSLPAPNDGWTVATSKDDPGLKSVDGRARWALRRAESAF